MTAFTKGKLKNEAVEQSINMNKVKVVAPSKFIIDLQF